MELVFKATSSILIALVFCQILGKQERDISLLLALVVCSVTVTAAISYLDPVIDFLKELQKIGNLNDDILYILLKAVGVGLITEIAALICNDMGQAALGKSLGIFSTAVILWLSLPLMKELLELINTVLGAE